MRIFIVHLVILGAITCLALEAAMAAPFTFTATGSMATPRYDHTVTLLPNAKVLVTGGTTSSGATLASSELYDPATGSWSATGGMATGRSEHTATLLPNGKVLVTGGYDGTASLATAELYDPATGSWSATGNMTTARHLHTATLLPNGKVLVTGGFNGSVSLAGAELYDPASGTWTATGGLATGRYSHTATLLPPNGNGKVLVLVTGGSTGGATLASSELYDPLTGSWSATGSMVTPRYFHTATLLPSGKVLVAGGFRGAYLASAELYDPATGIWSATGGMAAARDEQTATLLPSGKVLVTGGSGTTGDSTLTSAELYDPVGGNWSATGSMATERYIHTATLLPNGKVLVTGGTGSATLASSELYDSANGTWTATGNLSVARDFHSATLLPSGKVLVAGGQISGSNAVNSAERYDPAAGTWGATGNMTSARAQHTATLLHTGVVLVTGGYDPTIHAVPTAELYDPVAGSWTSTGSPATGRWNHTATLLANGKVLVCGGVNNTDGVLATAELYDPATGLWTATGSLATGRENHTATLLQGGQVLVSSGYGRNTNNTNSTIASSELYDPATGNWTTKGSLITARFTHTATLLPNGKVLVAGGDDNNFSPLASAELYDPASGNWSATANMTTARAYHTATLLSNGEVLVSAGGSAGLPSTYPGSSELYDPAAGSWTTSASLATKREAHTATMLTNGRVLVAGGYPNTTSAEIYDTGLGFTRPDWQPQITTATSPLQSGASLALTGSRFKGVSQASSGTTQDSSSNYPIVQLRSIDGSQLRFLPVAPAAGWSDTAFASTAVTGYPFGPALVTVFTNGIPSDAMYLVVTDVPPSSLNYSANPATYTKGTAISNNTPSSGGGAVDSYSISPALPSGLSFSISTGVISGTPTVVSPAADYTVTATNTGGSAIATVNIRVNDIPPSTLAYSTNPATYTKGTAITNNTPSSSGGAVVSYSVLPALPAGLSLDTGTGIISGTPTAVAAATDYTVTATNSGGFTTVKVNITVKDVPPTALTYSANPAVYTKTVTITNNIPSNGGGAVVSYSVLPALPAGLSLSTSTGIISGTPTALSAAANYTVTATNSGGSTPATVSITVNDVAPSALTYSTNPAIYTKGTAITNNTPSSTGGAVVSYSISPALPAGLTFSTSTGVISGTPTALSPAANYTVTATNTGGSTPATVNITVKDVAPSALTYSTNPATYTKGTAITNNTPSSSGGAVVSYSVSPALPTGLSFSTSTGVISGTPTALSPAANYTVTATNTGGSSPATVNITVNDVAPSALTYSANPAIYTTGTAITNNTPSSSGGPVVSYSISPALPTGLSCSTSTGVISGTPTALSAATNYTVTATNSGGSTPATVNITVNDVAPSALTYSTNPATYIKGTAITNNSPSSIGGAVVSYSISPALPAGLSFSTTTGVISGTPTSASPATDYTVTATNSGGSTTATVNITVNGGLVGNVSTRLPVGTGDNVLIEGFIVQGPAGSIKKIIVRAIGPSLAPFGITDALANPTLEIHDSTGATIATNDDWRTTQVGGLITGDQSAEISASQLAPSNDLESAIIANLAPGSYTAVVRGVNNTTGTGVVDAYDLSPSSPAKLANIATRGLVQPGDKLMIAGFIVQNGTVRAVIRAIGPSLTAFGISNALTDTTLQLRDQNGSIVVQNDDWKIRTDGSSQQAELEATGLQPTNDLEAAFLITLQPGQYTAQVRGKPEQTGIGVVQVYFLP